MMDHGGDVIRKKNTWLREVYISQDIALAEREEERTMDCENRSERVARSKSGDWQWLKGDLAILSGCQGSGTTHVELRY